MTRSVSAANQVPDGNSYKTQLMPAANPRDLDRPRASSFTWNHRDSRAGRGRQAVLRVYLDYPKQASEVPEFLRNGPDGVRGNAADLGMRTFDERDNRFINRGLSFETGEVFWVFQPWHIASDRRTIVIAGDILAVMILGIIVVKLPLQAHAVLPMAVKVPVSVSAPVLLRMAV